MRLVPSISAASIVSALPRGVIVSTSAESGIVVTARVNVASQSDSPGYPCPLVSFRSDGRPAFPFSVRFGLTILGQRRPVSLDGTFSLLSGSANALAFDLSQVFLEFRAQIESKASGGFPRFVTAQF